MPPLHRTVRSLLNLTLLPLHPSVNFSLLFHTNLHVSALQPVLHDGALAVALLRLTGLLPLFDLRDHALEGLRDVLVVARTGLDEAAAELGGEGLAVGLADLTLFGAEVGFVGYDHDGDAFGALLERG